MANLNARAWELCCNLGERAESLRMRFEQESGEAQVIDCGVTSLGGLEAGRCLAKVCLAGLADVAIGSGDRSVWPGPWVSVSTDRPVAACLGAQYAGWPVKQGSFFAMGSGPMRSARGREELLDRLQLTERSECAVGVLESDILPSAEVCRAMAQECGVDRSRLTVLVAPTASLAGTIQVVARSIETALHKMYELGYDVSRVVAGFGTAPLPPVAADSLTGIGWTNDSILYGARVTLWIQDELPRLAEIGPQIPSRSSADHGRPFKEIFERYERDFYRIDPLLFSPAEVHLISLVSGRWLAFGQTEPRLLEQSFGACKSDSEPS